jgi:DNA-binding transcriptional regulator YhcF (GntR family)
MSTGTSGAADEPIGSAPTATEVDVERDSDVPISTQIYWQLAYQIDSGRLLPGARLAPVREMGAALRVNPNTIRAVYRRLADAGYVTSRHGAGTHVADRPPQRRGAEALAGIVAEETLPQVLVPVATALAGIPALAVTEPQAHRLRAGQSIRVPSQLIAGEAAPGCTVRAMRAGELVALTRFEEGELLPLRIFHLNVDAARSS